MIEGLERAIEVISRERGRLDQLIFDSEPEDFPTDDFSDYISIMTSSNTLRKIQEKLQDELNHLKRQEKEIVRDIAKSHKRYYEISSIEVKK